MGGEAYIRVTINSDSSSLTATDAQVKLLTADAEKLGASLKVANVASVGLGGGAKVAAEAMGGMRERFAEARVEGGVLEGSMTSMVRGMEHMAASSSTLGPLIGAAFPVFAAVAFVEVIGTVVSALEHQSEVVRKQAIESDNLAIAATHSADSIAIENLKLEDQIAKLEGRPSRNALAEALIEAKDKADELGKALQGDVEKEVSLFSFDWTAEFTAKPTNIETILPGPGLVAKLIADWHVSDKIKSEFQGGLDAVQEARRKAAAPDVVAGTDQWKAALTAEAQAYETLTAKADQLSKVQGLQPAQLRRLTDLYIDSAQAARALRQTLAGEPDKEKDARLEAQKSAATQAREVEQVKIESLKKIELASIGAAEAVLKFEKETHQISASDAILQQRELEGEKLKIETDAKNAEIALLSKYPSADKTKDASKAGQLGSDIVELKTAQMGKIQALDAEYAKTQEASLTAASEAGLKFLDLEEKSRRETVEARLRIDERAVGSAEKIASVQLAASRSADDEALRTHRMSLNKWAAESIASIEQWAARQKPVIVRAMQDVQAAIQAETDPKTLDQLKDKYQALVDRLGEMDQKRLQDIQKINLQVEQRYEQMFQRLNGMFSGAFNEWFSGTKTFGAAFAQMGARMAEGMADNLLQMTLREVEHAAMVRILHRATAAADVATMSTAAAAKKSIEGAAASKSVVRSAADAAASTYASVAKIPYVGWVLAPPAAAAAFAAVMSFGSFASAERGMVVPADGTMAMLHEREMVLPAHLSTGMQNIIAGGGAGGSRAGGEKSGGGIQFGYNPTINAMNAKGVKEVFEGQRDQLRAMFFEMAREYGLGG